MDENETWTEKSPICKHNNQVACDPNTRCCASCGWDPDVAKVRLNRICREKNLQNPWKKGKQEKNS